MAIVCSVLARVAAVSQTVLRAEGNPTADTLGKRLLSSFTVRTIFCRSIYSKDATTKDFVLGFHRHPPWMISLVLSD